jgi:UDP-3-O-[3-hydroxymyristoyl] glucosamine N-acyltransferase
MISKNIAVFGYKDSFVGQVLNMLDIKVKNRIKFFISINKLPKLNIQNEHRRRPNNKTEFPNKDKIFNKDIYSTKDYISLLIQKKINQCFILEDDYNDRIKIFAELKKNRIKILSFIHSSSLLMGNNKIGEGVIIFPKCYIGYKTDINDCSIIGSNCCLEHHNAIGKFCNINPNVTTGGFCKINDFCEIHISSDLINRITINKKIKIGAGSLVLNDLEKSGVYYGRPAKFIKNII